MMRARIIGFALAASIPPIIMAVLSLTGDSGVAPGDIPGKLLLVGTAFVALLPYSALFVLLIGVPGYLVLRKLDLVAWWTAVVIGVFGGALVAVLVRSGSESYPTALLTYVPAGVLSALTFWFALKRGENRSTEMDR